jgi:transcriptional regulator GlxA family with amidase domain
VCGLVPHLSHATIDGSHVNPRATLPAGVRKKALAFRTQRRAAVKDFAIVFLTGMFGSSAAVTLDVLATARDLAAGLRVAGPRWDVWAPRGRASFGNGLEFECRPLTAKSALQARTIIFPGLGLHRLADIDARLEEADAKLCMRVARRHVQRGLRVAASCASVFLLQRAGLLEGRRATTSWWLGDTLQRRAAGSQVASSRMVVADGPVITAGAALAQIDLMLWLLREGFGGKLAELVARYLIIDGRETQSRYAIPTMLQSQDPVVVRFEELIASALPAAPSIRELARALNMSERTLGRRVIGATGRTPMEVAQLTRLNRARLLLESTRHSVASVAEQVGYADSTALRRLTRRLFGATPTQLRRLPGGLAESA